MNTVIQLLYLLTAVFFMLGVMRLRSPATARSGNQLAALGMAIALAATLWANHRFAGGAFIVLAALLGLVVGSAAALKVRMTAMPQMVALFNGMGGGAAALVAAGDWVARGPGGAAGAIAALFTVLVGSVSFSGSLIAFLKLQEWIQGRPIVYPGQKAVSLLLLLVDLAAGVALAAGNLGQGPTPMGLYSLLALLLGIQVVLPIGGADMPVVISLLNAMTGLAAAASGFLLQNQVLIIAGALVGASGTILTQQMSRAMNRPLSNILFGAFGQLRTEGGQAVEGTVQSATVEDVATLLAYARRVIIVPGYGLAVARAQQEVRQLMDKLLQRNVDVRFAIHPVAGRMPGHMNVLLAEADVPYDRLYEMEVINPEFAQTDVALVIGANDVTNPAARTQPSSPLYGMPILNVDQAAHIVVLKRSMNPGFAGVDNPLYLNPKTQMLFGDAKASLTQLLKALDEV